MAIRAYTGVELILKARLLHEHWTLIVTKSRRFEAGDFVSVTFEEACKRLAEAVQDPVPPDAREKFDELRKLRNRIVHFAPPEGTHLAEWRANEREAQEIALRAWGALHKLIGDDWHRVFEPYFSELDTIERHLKLVMNGPFDDPVTAGARSAGGPGPVD